MTYISLEDVASVLFQSPERTDHTRYGSVEAVNADNSYQVRLNESEATTRCARLCNAEAGDRVLVLVQANGHCAAIGRVGGDAGSSSAVVLFSSTSGTSSEISIGSYDFADFESVNIMYGKLDGGYGGYQTQTVYEPNGKAVILSQNYTPRTSSNTYMQWTTSRWVLSGSTCTPDYDGRYVNRSYTDGSMNGNSTGANDILIYLIVGYPKSASATVGGYRAGDGIEISGDTISSLAADYVVEQGSTSTGSYRKWSSGKLECWVKQTYTGTISTSWGNGYRTSGQTGAAWPVAFTEIQFAYQGLTGGSGDMAFIGVQRSATTTNAPDFYLTRMASLTSSRTFEVQHYGVGTWK